jgi:ATP-dependent DNA ligase
MLAQLADPFDSEEHLFEIKWDGSRVVAFVESGRLRLQSRRLLDITYRYPDLKAHLPAALKQDSVILDGELIATDPEGRPDFNLLQSREQQQSPFRIRVAAERTPVTYMAFDVLQVGDKPLIHHPLAERRKILSYLLRPSPCIAERRSGLWLKIKPRRSGVFYIMGYTPGEGGRAPFFGSLAVGEEAGGEVRYRARVGSGLSEEQLADLLGLLRGLETGEVSKVGGRGGPRLVHWVRPVLRCRVSYQERTKKSLRAPVFEGLVD